MSKLLSTKYIEVRWEPRWPAIALGFYCSRPTGRTFLILFAPLVIEIGRRK